MKWNLKKQIIMEFSLALALLAAIGTASYRSIKIQTATAQRIAQSHQVIAELEMCLSKLKDAILARQSYSITGDRSYLDSYNESRNSVALHFQNLGPLCCDDVSGQRKIGELKRLIDDRIDLLERRLPIQRNPDPAAASRMEQALLAEDVTGEIRRVVNEIEREEAGLLEIRKREEKASNMMTAGLIPIGSVLAISVVALSLITINRELNRRREAELTLKQANDALEQKVSDRTVEVEQHAKRLRMTLSEREEFLKREQALRAHAESASRFKDEFLAVVSHELRAPLNAINGYAHLLGNASLSDEDSRHAIEIIQRNAKTQARLIDELLDTSHIITGKLRLNLQRSNLKRIIYAALDAVRPAADAKGIEVAASLDDEMMEITGDPARLQQVIWNVLSNAVKFTPSNGAVSVRANRVDSLINIVINDTGQGISPDFLPFVFDRFRQQDGSHQRVHSGMGLGLAIARHLVEMHGGTITAESKGSDCGTTFSITLPFTGPSAVQADSKPAPVIYEDEPQLLQPELKGLRVLVVGDDDDVRKMLTSLLSHYGLTVLACASADEAFEKLQAFRPDLLISDIGMPEADGYALIKNIRKLPPQQCGSIPAIALTALARGNDRVDALAAGYQTHIPKPVEPAELRVVIANLTQRFRIGSSENR